MNHKSVNAFGIDALANANRIREVRFVDCNFNTLFFVPNYESIIVTKSDGTQLKHKCIYIDDYHAFIGQRGFHIMEFAEMAWRNGYSYLPEHPREQDCCDTYALYQIKDVHHVEYYRGTYAKAEKKIRPSDYCCVYRSNLGVGVMLEELRNKHSRNHHTQKGIVRPLYVSDIIVMNYAGKQVAYYTETETFQKLPAGFTDVLSSQQKIGKDKQKVASE